MDASILSLHHVTATVTDPQTDLDFFTRTLGLRLVKKTVNFDNPGVYHFYYGDERGTPSTLMTTFPYGGKEVPVGTKGAGQIVATAFSVPRGSLERWRERLQAHDVETSDPEERFGEAVVRLADPSGLVIELHEAEADERASWAAPGIDRDAAIRGLHGVTLMVRDPGPTLDFLTEVLGVRAAPGAPNEGGRRHRMALGDGGPGSFLDVVEAEDAPRAVNGLGTVHHVAMAVPDAEHQLAAREELLRRGHQVTEVRDRQYFQSIYFREPGGILYEIATVGPGFLIDEEPAELGRNLRIPSWEEANRSAIEAGLPPVSLE